MNRSNDRNAVTNVLADHTLPATVAWSMTNAVTIPVSNRDSDSASGSGSQPRNFLAWQQWQRTD